MCLFIHLSSPGPHTRLFSSHTELHPKYLHRKLSNQLVSSSNRPSFGSTAPPQCTTPIQAQAQAFRAALLSPSYPAQQWGGFCPLSLGWGEVLAADPGRTLPSAEQVRPGCCPLPSWAGDTLTHPDIAVCASLLGSPGSLRARPHSCSPRPSWAMLSSLLTAGAQPLCPSAVDYSLCPSCLCYLGWLQPP